MTYDPRIAPLFDIPTLREIKEKPMVKQREYFAAQSEAYLKSQEWPKVNVSEIKVGNIRFLHYKPQIKTQTAILYIHGGGWCLGSPESYDHICRHLCEKTNAQIFSLGYRLAPENPFPAAHKDALFACDWLINNAENFAFDPNNLTIMGDSAGGNLATVVCHERASAGKIMPIAHVLIYPAVDHSKTYPSETKFNHPKYHLTTPWYKMFKDSYLNNESDAQHPMISPILYPSHKGLPDTLILAASHDILVDGIVAFEKDLKRDGVNVETYYDETMFHGYVGLVGFFDEALVAVEKCAEFICKKTPD